MLIILHLGRRLYDRRTGLVGAVVFATSLQILERARWASIDMTLNLFVLGAIVLLIRAAETGGRWPARLAWGLMALATLAKGPVGVVLPLIATVPAVVVLHGPRAAARLVPPAGVALYLAVTLAWFGPFAARLGPERAIAILTKETVDRYVDAWNARHPAWYYLWNFPAGFFPWSVLLPWAVMGALRPGPAATAGAPGDGRAPSSRSGWRPSSCSSRSRPASGVSTSSRSIRRPPSWWRACSPAPTAGAARPAGATRHGSG
jgi:4-amino-4-deoxy-L-arabinose transferase